ncbi:MAG: hypothetical protein A2X17_07740 [Bacteroidetes bacterium GWF2_41_61]|jgi:tetratricopeptide (TPR) repeat protein|nr:MAG: hypothetical protein A2X20_12020 [Bacteroidetes bacterium GWE2_40_15]OFY30087.1 MAG: hypothetical protein A2X17_07740 [Bacteroidetes bacterium GWF2_41_61]OFY91762.1 MAG: hypothetical protein A2266_07780 [Bacteroidetes bacterium RIFOXYA12_FULL_40_10]PKP05751.1 MAG: hypothetical protein CVU10_10405 [Bacteroidetes bacterium HGW-Bacteroidetes-5]HBG23609.1 hypothetical protein [Rikenellaceae bacterium]
MKKIIILLLIFITVKSGIAQNTLGKSDDLGRVALAVMVPDMAENIPQSAKQLLENKMMQIATINGLGAGGLDPRFCIVPMVNILTKDVTPTAPPMIALNMEITFYIVDAVNQIIFVQTTMAAKGVGQTEDKAYISGIRNVNARAGQFKGFIENGKNKIIEYYNSQCDAIIKKAQSLAGMKQYEEALFYLLSVPDVCRECYDKCMDVSVDVYKNYADYKCTQYLSAARAAWANMDADLASQNLAMITPDMSCYNDATKLVDVITKKMIADGANVWNFKMKRYDDAVETERLIIKAKRDVAVAWAVATYWNNYNYNWGWLYRNRY